MKTITIEEIPTPKIECLCFHSCSQLCNRTMVSLPSQGLYLFEGQRTASQPGKGYPSQVSKHQTKPNEEQAELCSHSMAFRIPFVIKKFHTGRLGSGSLSRDKK